VEKTVAGRIDNLKPWKRGESGNPGGRPKTKPLTEELARLLEQEAPNGKGDTWAVVIAQALLTKARKGDVRAITELANRVEGKALQAVEVNSQSGPVTLIHDVPRPQQRRE
jgi:hypothetical protein